MIIDKRELRIAAIFILCIALLSMFQEKLGIKMEAPTILTLCFAVFLFLIPNLSALSKFKIGEVELEFKHEVDKLEKLVKAEEVSNPNAIQIERGQEKPESWQYYYQEYQDILKSSSSNLEKVLKAAQLIEHMIMVAGKDFGVDPAKLKSPYEIITELKRLDLITEQEVNLYKEFLHIRNKIIHGDLSILDDVLTVRLLDLSWRIVRIFG